MLTLSPRSIGQPDIILTGGQDGVLATWDPLGHPPRGDGKDGGPRGVGKATDEGITDLAVVEGPYVGEEASASVLSLDGAGRVVVWASVNTT